MTLKVLPSPEYTFTIHMTGSVTGQVYDGTFTYKKPNLGAQSEIEKTLARLNGDLKSLAEEVQGLHRMWATFRHTLIQSPDWFQKASMGYDFYDANVLYHIYEELAKFEADWQAKVQGVADPKKEEQGKAALQK